MKKEEILKRMLLAIVIFSLILFITPSVIAAKPYCGDGKCSVKETALTCPADCGCVPRTETCNNIDDDCNGLIDENLLRQCGVTDVGRCEYGAQTCSVGVWGSCIGNIDPSPEVCEGSIDENCNGVVDEGCECINGQTRQCGTDVGRCEFGIQTCSGGAWGACVGEVPPTTETCNNLDDDCNGIIDNGLTQVCGVTDVGACQYGVSTCSAGIWGNCIGSIDPVDESIANENCGDGRDNDCDGLTDTDPECRAGGTDYTDKICNVDGSASSTKVKCGLGDVNMNEDSTDATFGDCQDGTNDNYMWIEDVFVDATKVLTTDTVAVKCDVKCFSSSTKYAIAYNNGSGWRNLDYGSCNAGGIESKTKTVNIDDIPGTHYFRCMEKWYYEFTGVEICDSNTYSDNDDMSVEVIEGVGIPEITECKLLNQPNKLYVLNQDIVQSLDETCIVISAENTTIDCKGHSITSDFSKTGIYSNASNTTIKNCNISMGEVFEARGIELNGANNSYIYNNTLNNQGIGLILMNTSRTIIEQNIINYSLYGILIDNSAGNKMINNFLDSNYRGISSTASDTNQIINNTLNSNLYGVYLTTSNENILENNILNSNLYGVYLTTSNENILENNILNINPYGVYLTTSNESIIESNKVSSSTYAVYIDRSLDVNITRNTMNLNHHGVYIKSSLGPSKYEFNGNELTDNLDTNIINTNFISESTERIYNQGQQISFDLNITHINGSSSDDFIYDVSIYPGEEYTAIKNNKILTISFIPTKEGLYSLIANITTSSGNTEIRKFIFLVGDINSGIIRYYFHDDPSTHGQYFDTPWVGQDFGSMLSYPVNEEEYRTCGRWVQFHPDDILKPLYIIKNVNINWWYKVSTDPGRQFSPYVGIERYATPLDIYDYTVSIPEAMDYILGKVEFTNLNLTSDYLWRPYWLSINLFGENPFVMSSPSNLSYADFTYLYAGPKIEKFEGIEGDLGNVNLLSSVFKDDSKNNAFLQLKGQGTFNIAVQMPDISKDYDIKMDGIECSLSSNCELNSQLNGKLDLNLILNGQHILEIIYGEGGTDYTDRTCNIDGSASSTGIPCSGKNEDLTDATFDSCIDGTSNNYMHIGDIFIDATKVLTTDTVQVTCNVCCYSSGTEYGILYNNGSGWQNKQYGNCVSGSGSSICTAIESKTVNIPVDDVVGTHYFRCWESYSSCDATTKCCSSTYADNDDMSIGVI